MAFDKKKTVFWGIGLLLIAAGVFAAYTWLALSWSYSRGEQAGPVRSFPRRAGSAKPGKGELTMVQLPGAIPEKFFFTVRNEGTVQK